jgi:hypothetical protein
MVAFFLEDSVYVSPLVARQRLGKNVIAATNTHATVELLDPSFLFGPCRIKEVISSSQKFTSFFFLPYTFFKILFETLESIWHEALHDLNSSSYLLISRSSE